MLVKPMPPTWVSIYKGVYARLGGVDDEMSVPTFRYNLAWLHRRAKRGMEERRSIKAWKHFHIVKLLPLDICFLW